LHPYLTNTTTGRAGGFVTVFGTASVTGITFTQGWNTNFAGNTAYRLFQVKFYGKAKVRTALLLSCTTAPASTAEDITEDITENITDIKMIPGKKSRA